MVRDLFMEGSTPELGQRLRSFFDGAVIFAPDILGRQLHVEHGRVNLRMSHKAHQSGYGNAGTDHVGAKSVAKPMRVGVDSLSRAAMVTKQRTQSGGSHRLATPPAFEREKQEERIRSRSFEFEIPRNNPNDLICQGQNPLSVPFATNEDLAFGKPQIFEPELDRFMRTQAVEKHQSNETKVAESAKAGPETCDFIRLQGNDDFSRLT